MSRRQTALQGSRRRSLVRIVPACPPDHGARSTWRCRPACPTPQRSLQTRSQPILQDENARLARRDRRQTVTELRHATPPAQPLGRACAQGADILLERVVAPRGRTLRDVTTSVERQAVEPVENAATHPRPIFRQSFASASWAASRASSGSPSTWAARRPTRGAWRAHSTSRAWASPSLASHEDGVAESVVRKAGGSGLRQHRFGGVGAETVAPGESTAGRWRSSRLKAKVQGRRRTALAPAASRVTTASERQRRRPTRDSVPPDDPTVVTLPHLRGFLLTAVVVAISLVVVAPASAAAPRVLAATLADDINPVSQRYLQDQVRRAEAGGYDALVVELDTPGGLSTSMRAIVKTFLASSVPIVVHVSPSGLRAPTRPER